MTGDRRPDAVILELARGQHGLVARVQLLAAGLRPGAVDRRLRTGQLRRVHAGVYQVGPVASPRAGEMAAVLACGGERVAIGHDTAALLWQLPGPSIKESIAVIVWGAHRGRRPGIRVHRSRLLPEEVTRLDGVPVTTPARTLLDLAGWLGPRELERAVAHAERADLIEPAMLRKLLERHRRRRGVRSLRAFVTNGRTAAFVRSEAEARLLGLVRSGGLPEPATNVQVRGFEVDLFWRGQRLVVEVDGFAYHSSVRAFERDRSRDATLTAAGMRVMRFTWQQLVDQPNRILVNLAQALAR
jgi:very-short-patch-repair endonuclease